MSITEFLSSPAEMCKREGPHDRIVMSSRVRLARNLKGYAFPGWAKKADRIKTLEVIRPAVEHLPHMVDAFSDQPGARRQERRQRTGFEQGRVSLRNDQ
jgi:protein arginine kinase